jgi:glutamate/tyrosine decarboxylase-like PLP-dependent enzyme
VSTYDQNAFGSNDSIAPQLERQTIEFLKQMLGLDESYFGTFVTGATVSNFASLAIGRQWVGEQLGIDISVEGASGLPVTIVSGTPHSSIIKSMSMLGIGRKNIIKIPTVKNRESVDIESLRNFLAQHTQPCIVVANAGTVNTGDFDDLEAIGKLKEKYKFWLHVDAAFGGFAVLSKKHQRLMNGINHADSITIDAHKWLNVPYDAAMQFTKRKDLQLKIFQNSAAYLGDPSASPDYFHYTPENSRRWRALPAWFTLMAYGKEGYTEIIERNCTLAEQLGEWISQSDAFTLLSPVRLNIVCFTLKDATPEKIKHFLEAVRDNGRAFFTPTVYNSIPAIRAAFSNWQTTYADIEIAMEALNKIAHDKQPLVK